VADDHPMLWNLFFWGVTVLAVWWLSGYDSNLTGDNRKKDFTRRAIRCGFTLVLLAIVIWLPPAVIILSVLLGVIWAGCLAELFSHGFRRLVYAEHDNDREFDPQKDRRHLDAIAHLIQTGRRDEAIKLCGELKRSGEVNPVTLEATLAYLGEKPERPPLAQPLADAARRRSRGDFAGAEQQFRSLLAANPENLAAAMALMRLYAQDLHQSGRAAEVLRQLEKQPRVSAGYIEFARRTMAEWSRPPVAPDPAAVSPRAVSVAELLADGRFGTAIEILEAQIQLQPDDFDLRLKLAEAYGRYCGNVDHAEKIVREIETTAGFSPAQVQQARNQLQAWRNARPARAA
jgi:thioredoxin-like negative regulator of GroEL